MLPFNISNLPAIPYVTDGIQNLTENYNGLCEERKNILKTIVAIAGTFLALGVCFSTSICISALTGYFIPEGIAFFDYDPENPIAPWTIAFLAIGILGGISYLLAYCFGVLLHSIEPINKYHIAILRNQTDINFIKSIDNFLKEGSLPSFLNGDQIESEQRKLLREIRHLSYPIIGKETLQDIWQNEIKPTRKNMFTLLKSTLPNSASGNNTPYEIRKDAFLNLLPRDRQGEWTTRTESPFYEAPTTPESKNK